MVIQEKQLKNGYKYFIPEIFGEITFWSKSKLDKNILDLIIMRILSLQANKGVIRLQGSEEKIRYTFKKISSWEDD